MRNIDLKEIWRRGVSLRAVYSGQFDFETDLKIGRACRKIAQASSTVPQLFSELFEQLRFAEDRVWPDVTFHKLNNAQFPHGDDNDTFLSHLDILELLRREILIAIGFQAPRIQESEPCMVPADVWDGTIAWEDDRLTGNGLSFVGVRVAPPLSKEALDTLPEPPREDKVAAMPTEPVRPEARGPKSRKEEIIAAYQGLKRGSYVDENTPLKQLGPAIREYLKANTPLEEWRERGLGDETVRRVIQKWRADRS